MTSCKPTIRIVELAGEPDTHALQRNIAWLEGQGYTVLCERLSRHPDFPLSAASAQDRARVLESALTEKASQCVIASRGGYGVSEILNHLDLEKIRNAPAKILVGFSDICALHSALLSTAGRAGLHAPMPGSKLFGRDTEDIQQLHQLLSSELPWRGRINVTAPGPEPVAEAVLHGWLFGGNLAVLTNLIGTPWFPSSLAGAIVFLEDVGEHAGRVGRYITQWQQSGATRDIKAVVLGCFSVSGDGTAGQYETIVSEVRRRVSCPVFTTADFGHVSPNHPIATGADARITGSHLEWQLSSLTPFAS